MRVGDVVKRKSKYTDVESVVSGGVSNVNESNEENGQVNSGGHSRGFWLLFIIQLLLYSLPMWMPTVYLLAHTHQTLNEFECNDILMGTSYLGVLSVVVIALMMVYMTVMFKAELKSKEEYRKAESYSFWTAVIVPAVISMIGAFKYSGLNYSGIVDGVSMLIVMLIIDLIVVSILKAGVKATLYEGVINGESVRVLGGMFFMIVFGYIFTPVAEYMLYGTLCIVYF